MNPEFKDVEKRTLDIYTRNGAAFDMQRPKRLHERSWLERLEAQLPDGGSLLDVGCGAAEPIAAYYIEKGYDVTGVDFSPSMIALAQSRFPDNTWLQADMRALDLSVAFNGIIAWNSFFHLNQGDQRQTLRRFERHLLPEGALMVTVGPHEGEVLGHVNGEEVYHSSLAPGEYRSILDSLGMDILEFVFEDESCDQQTVLLAKKRT